MCRSYYHQLPKENFVGTFKFYVSNIFHKLGVDNRVEAVKLAIEQKLVYPLTHPFRYRWKTDMAAAEAILVPFS